MSDDYFTRRAFRGCMGKARYATQDQAMEVLKRCERERPERLRIYHCQVCSGWHLSKTWSESAPSRCGTCLQPLTARAPGDWQCAECQSPGEDVA